MNKIRDLYEAGLALTEAGARLGINKEAVRSRARRMGIRWNEPAAYSPYDVMSEAERMAMHRDGDSKLLRALAAAFQRGDHLPQTMREAA